MNQIQRDILLKSWSNINEIALIKEVATKGEHVELCQEYLATKKQITIEASLEFFHTIVNNYINNLLNNKLIYKAENVIQNLKRDVKSIYYQFAFECDDIHDDADGREHKKSLQNCIYDYLKKKNCTFNDWQLEYENYQFYWNILQEIQKLPKNHIIIKNLNQYCKFITLENFLQIDTKYQNYILIQIYFKNNTQNEKLLQKLNHKYIWEFFIQHADIYINELIIWCNLQIKLKMYDNNTDHLTTELLNKFIEWEIDENMYEMAIETLQNIPEVLKDLFICRGYIFPDEIHNISIILNRIFRTHSLNKNINLIEKLPIAKHLFENEIYSLLLEDFVHINDIETLKSIYVDQLELLNMIICLKSTNLLTANEFLKLSYLNSEFLVKNNINKSDNEQSIIEFGKFLLNNKNLDDIQNSIMIQKIPYMLSLLNQIYNQNNTKCHINVNDLIKKHLNIDMIELCKEYNHEFVSFTNSYLCQKYAQEYKLNFLHYLKQQRSSYAIYCFFIEQLTNYSQISRSQLFGSVETVTDLAIINYQNLDLFGHCVCFIEMLGFDTQNLRSLIHLIQKYCPNNDDDILLDSSQIIQISEEQMFGQDLNEKFPLHDYESIMRLSKIYNNKIQPDKYLILMATQNNWWKLLIFFQYFHISCDEIKKICKYFEIEIIGEHLVRALTHDTISLSLNGTADLLLSSSSEKSNRKFSFSRQRSTNTTRTENNLTTSGDTITSSLSSNNATDSYNIFKSNQQLKCLPDSKNLDLFAIIILSTSTNANIPEERITTYTKFIEIIHDQNNSYSTSCNLMKNCIKYKRPILSILSSTISNLNHDWNWLVWLIVSTDNYHLIESPPGGVNCNDIALQLIEICVKQGLIRTLHKSFSIFMKDNQFIHFTKFLLETISFNFIDINLRLYFLALSNDEIYLPLIFTNIKSHKDQMMFFTIKLIIQNLKYNFTSATYQQNYLDLLSNSGLSDIYPQIDFTLLRDIFTIISPNKTNFDFEQLLDTKKENRIVYENLLSDLTESKEYVRAIQLAGILNISACDIIYEKWINQLILSTTKHFNFNKYEIEMVEHSLPPEFLVNFYLYVAEQYTEFSAQKYLMYKAALNVIKYNHLFANESFDRDLIEYEMILCFLKNHQNIHEIEIYHSEYFEEILSKERCVLYKSFNELKDLAGIDDLTTNLKVELTKEMKCKLNDLLNELLDQGDIVEALRLQAMFEHPTVDLRYLVFCMALAEGLTTIYSLSHEERMIFLNAEKNLFTTKFEKRTLDQTPRPNPAISTTHNRQNDNNSDNNLTLGFEEIPAKEKQKVLEALQGFASNLKHGLNLGKRIVMVYRAAMYLDKDYSDVFRTKDIFLLLKNATEWECLKKLLVVNDIFTSFQMTSVEISNYLGHEITTAIIRPLFYILTADQENLNYHQSQKSMMWGYDLDREFHLFLELCPATTLLGKRLLEYCDVLKVYRKFQDNQPYQQTPCFEKLQQIIKKYGLPSRNSRNTPQVLSHKKQNTIYVELLIKAHECFVHECSMEGIADVLNRAKILNTVLTNAKSWKLIARILTGIGRYREMFYCFDTLIKNDQFEFLLGQFDAEKVKGLRYATISYIRDTCPQNQEHLNLVALHFLMFKELAEMWEEKANLKIAKLLETYKIIDNETITSSSQFDFKKFTISKLQCSIDVQNILNEILENLSQSCENYLLDDKLRLAQQTAAKAELIALQINLVNKELSNGGGACSTPLEYKCCICVLNIESREEFRDIIISELNAPQAIIMAGTYSYDINWSEVLLWQFVIFDRHNYLEEFIKCMDLTDIMIENIVKGFQLHTHTFPNTMKMISNLEILVKMVQSVTSRYKLASLLSFKNIITVMLNDESLYYLKDTNYGRNENNSTDD